MKYKKNSMPDAQLRTGSLATVGALALASVALLGGCSATLPGGGSDSCTLSANQNADIILDEALAGLDAGCGETHYEGYFSRLIEVSKTAPTEPDRVARIVELVNSAEAKGVITHQGKIETINSYFNVKFVAAKSKNTIFSKGCDNQGRIFRALDAELRLKKVGLAELGQDISAYNSAKALSENLKGTFEAACQASNS